jgi:hypothetical protein
MNAIFRICGCRPDCAMIPQTCRTQNRVARSIQLAGLLLLLSPFVASAQQAVDEDAPWPRVRSTNGSTVTLYLPEVESWTSNSFSARAVVEVKPAKTKKNLLGVVWFDAHGSVDRANRLMNLDRLEITKGNFPGAPNNGSNALALARELFPGGARTVSLDYLITALGFEQAAARQNAQEFDHTPPAIVWQTNRAVLIVIDGDPVLRPISGSSMERVINTPGLMIQNPADGKFYLSGSGQWFSADSLQGSWSLVQIVPPDVAALSPPLTNSPPTPPSGSAPKIIVSTKPSELLISDGLPDFKSIPGTGLQYAANADGLLFFQTKERAAYLLLSGRWFKAPSLQGPWTYVSPDDLPDDFAKIPHNSPRAMVLASVPGTSEAELASVANSMPTTATVDRHDTKIDLSYDGEPQFKPIEGTAMSYAINAQLPVISLGTNYYAVDNAVWFVASSPAGPWEVATEVPEEIYTIPPTSPVYYATFARIYDSDTNSVEVGYTPGYTGSYEDDGTTVYGTGYDYDPYYGNDYYGWGWTWGYGYWYVPWYGWWVWRPWWGAGNGLRAAIIDNIYDRWNTPGVRPHDRLAGAEGKLSALQNGYPALYGRFKGTAGRTPFLPPADTIALNPYSRTQNALRPGEMPRGAQLLTNVRQSAGGGRDLYAAPDGNIYQRRTDGWYRQAAAGKWDFFAPAQGRLDRGQIALGNAVAGGGQNRIAAQNAVAARAQSRGYQGGNMNAQARQQVAANLDRQYYARQVGQMRAQNMRPANRPQAARGRPVRAGGRGRR